METPGPPLPRGASRREMGGRGGKREGGEGERRRGRERGMGWVAHPQRDGLDPPVDVTVGKKHQIKTHGTDIA